MYRDIGVKLEIRERRPSGGSCQETGSALQCKFLKHHGFLCAGDFQVQP